MDNLSGKSPSSTLKSLSESANCPPSPSTSGKSKTKTTLQSAFHRSKGKRPPKLTVTSELSNASESSPVLSPGYAVDSSSESEHRPEFSTSRNLSNRVSSALKLTIPKRWKRSSKPNSPQSTSAHLPSVFHKKPYHARTNSPEKKLHSLSHSSSFPAQSLNNLDSPVSVSDVPNSPTQPNTLGELAASTLSVLPLQTSKTTFFVGSPSRSSNESLGSHMFRTKSSNSFSSSLSNPSPTSNRSANFEEHRASLSSESNRPRLSLSDFSLPSVEDGETPAAFLDRLQASIPSRFIPSLLSQSNLSFMKITLRKYLSNLPLKDIALDMALRKFLALYVLPQETQQIDRVLSSFSDQYYHCNPMFYESSDECYILTFSLMILHTDFYNTNNRQKMTKGEFISNTNLPNILPEILECFYDNITYTPFVHVEEDPNSIISPSSDRPSFSQRFGDSQFRLSKRSSLATESDLLAIEEQLTGFRINLQSILDYNHFEGISIVGSSICPNASDHYKQFMTAPYIQIVSHRSQPQAFSFHFAPETENESTNPAVVNIKVFKLGIVLQNERARRDRFISGREVGVFLTSSQLMFFKNISWVEGLMSQLQDFQCSAESPPHYFTPSLTSLNPDYIIPLSDLVAFTEKKPDIYGSYSFIIKQKNSTTYMFSTESEQEMNDWIHKVNFVSAFATSGIAPREKLCCVDRSDNSVKASVSILPEIEEDKDAMTKVSHETGSEMLECSKLRIFIVQNRICKLEERLHQVECKFSVERGNVENLLRMAPIQTRTRVRLVRAANNLKKVLRLQMIELCKLQSSIKILKEDLELDNHLQQYLHSVFPSPPSCNENSSAVLYPSGYSGNRSLSNASVRRNQLRLGKNSDLQNLRGKSGESEASKTEDQGESEDANRPTVKQDIVTLKGQRLSVVEVPDDFVPEKVAQESSQSETLEDSLSISTRTTLHTADASLPSENENS
ncbi:guanyl-nucleotide exchange factor Sec74 [Schizosaccharomyces cryophilus OY26]|uniref:Guanyl-nucleotide exchange factor Sec74 n=1 Tax=Schizosaccharomyces cryophilus (strain OY26 / ATCC MYA-4695 / CBS 11777 / NBRC 106824 / NRRL Y48691) TaxID=653667 RepID=S9VVQ4_SCHCR|nr:guanyl-nucleotide exchange factor Sec74 [Schizosaccharomyces cryophilus OY26]EPY50210.1 guanyl-nucleotide exchange factor Sec74 [Schizosaccharomyces cryophilus OY26]